MCTRGVKVCQLQKFSYHHRRENESVSLLTVLARITILTPGRWPHILLEQSQNDIPGVARRQQQQQQKVVQKCPAT